MKVFTAQRRLAADILKAGSTRVKFDPAKMSDIKEAITREDVKKLIKNGAIYKIQKQGISQYRARKIKIQKSKGRQKGAGSRKGSPFSRLGRKRAWILRVRVQRRFLKDLKQKKLVSSQAYSDVYQKIKGGYFRSRRHIKLYLEERNLFTKK